MIDVNAYIGHHPFRQIDTEGAGGLLRLMDRCRIEQAVVCPFEGVFYVELSTGMRRGEAAGQAPSEIGSGLALG